MTTQPSDIIEAAARLEFDAVDDVVNVFQVRLASPVAITDQETLDDIVDYLELAYTLLVGFLSVLTTFRDIRVRNVTQDTVLGLVPWNTLSAGSAVSDALPPGVAALVNFTTGVPRVTPRKYIGVSTEAQLVDPGVFSDSFVIALGQFAAQMIGLVPVNGRLYEYGFLSPKTSAFQASLAATVTSIPAYQRRRKQGRGS